jgi:hypothetical protein
MPVHRRMWILFVVVFVCSVFSTYSYAIPAFSRQYGTSCGTCHVDFPKLNDFGKAFKDAGFKFPKDDETFIKLPPTMLGAPAQKELWPHAIYPGTIPGIPQIGLRFNTFFQVVSNNRNNFNLQNPGDPALQQFIPQTDFQPGLFSIFTAGNFGDGIAFWVDDDISVGGANSSGSLGDGYLKFVDLGRVFKLPTDALSLRVGQFELDLPFSQARTWNLSGWDIYGESNFNTPSATGTPSVSNAFSLEDAARGVELSGGHTYRGYHYSLAIVDQNTGGTHGSGTNVSPQVTYVSDSNFKDSYGRVSYRFNLERDRASRTEVQAAGTTGPRDHTYLNLGTLYFYGRAVQRYQGQDLSNAQTVITAREPFYRLGGDFSFNYHAFNLFGQYLYGHDQNQLPFIPSGQPLPTSFTMGPAATFSGGFLEADYVAYPWLMAIMRWDEVKSTSDYLNGIGADVNNPPPSSFFGPYSSTRNRFTPGIQFLIHANIKASFEYQVRPQQIVYVPGSTIRLTNPFRTNAAVTGLEWVY